MKSRKSLALVVALSLFWAAGCHKGMHIDSLKPASGVISGNETIQIRGSGFKPDQGVTVYFGTARAQNAFVEGTTKVYATTPVYDKSTIVDVRIISDDGEEVILRKGFKYLKSAKWTPFDAFGGKKKKSPAE